MEEVEKPKEENILPEQAIPSSTPIPIEEKPISEEQVPESPKISEPTEPTESIQPPETSPELKPPQTAQPAETPVAESSPIQTPPAKADFRILMRQAKIKKREAKLERLLNFARQKGKISNRDVRKFLRVSDATATRYAKELINRGLLRKFGKTKSTYYEAI